MLVLSLLINFGLLGFCIWQFRNYRLKIQKHETSKVDFNRLKSTLNEFNDKMNTISETQKVSQRTLEESVNAVSELESMARNVAQYAFDANNLGLECKDSISNHRQSFNGLKESTSQVLNDLKSVNNTSDFIKELALNSHILSLNASIEAAKSGESGKSFSIIAKEISTMANNVGENNKLITEAANRVQSNIKVNEKSIKDSSRKLMELEDTISHFIEKVQQISSVMEIEVKTFKDLLINMNHMKIEFDKVVMDVELHLDEQIKLENSVKVDKEENKVVDLAEVKEAKEKSELRADTIVDGEAKESADDEMKEKKEVNYSAF